MAQLLPIVTSRPFSTSNCLHGTLPSLNFAGTKRGTINVKENSREVAFWNYSRRIAKADALIRTQDVGEGVGGRREEREWEKCVEKASLPVAVHDATAR